MTDDLVSWSSVLSQVSLGTPPLISLLTISDKKHRSGSDWQRQSSIVGAWNNLFKNVVISPSQGCRISLCGKQDDPLQTSCARQKVWHIAPLIYYLFSPCLHLMFLFGCTFCSLFDNYCCHKRQREYFFKKVPTGAKAKRPKKSKKQQQLQVT